MARSLPKAKGCQPVARQLVPRAVRRERLSSPGDGRRPRRQPGGDEVRRHLGGGHRGDQARRAADRRRARAGPPVVAVLSARGKTTDRAARGGARDLRAPRPPRDGHAALDRRADLLRALRDGDQRPRPPRDLADRLAGGDRHRLLPHQGADHRRARRPHPPGARGGLDRAGRRLPGRLHRQPRRDHARPRRLGHDRGRARRRPRRRGLRDLHRRRRRLHRRSRGSSPTRASCRSSPTRRCWRWPPRAPRCCSCARSSTRATTASASTAAARSRTAPVPSSSRSRRRWNDRS